MRPYWVPLRTPPVVLGGIEEAASVLGTDKLISPTPTERAHLPSKSAHDGKRRSAHKPSTRTGERWAYGWVDRRLKVMSVLLPVCFILALELVHYRIEARDQHLNVYWDGYHAVFVGITVASILVFGLVMFRFIDRAQRQVVRQNHELAATNALSSAVPVSYTHLRAHETRHDLVCRL